LTQLSELEHRLWRRLSVFADHFSHNAIQAVAAGTDIASEQVIPLLDQLIAQGVVIVESSDHEARYRLPDALRPMAHAQLIDRGEADAVYSCLVAYYSSLAEQVLQEASGPNRATWMGQLEREHANLRVVLGWLAARGDAERGLELAFLLQELWFEDAHTSEGRTWFATLLALPQASPRTMLRAQALDLAGALAFHQGDHVTARTLQEEGLDILREKGDMARIGYALNHLAYVVAYAQGDLHGAQTLYQEALRYFRELGNADGTAHTLANMGTGAILLGDYVAARPLVMESLQMYRELGYMYNIALSLSRAAGIAAGMNQPERALRLAGASSAACTQIGVSRPGILQEVDERIVVPARQVLSEERQRALWAEGETMALEEAVVYALDSLALAAPES
jgi:tetratricopeptide (TPR) repeat protein